MTLPCPKWPCVDLLDPTLPLCPCLPPVWPWLTLYRALHDPPWSLPDPAWILLDPRLTPALPYPSLLISDTECQNLRSLKAIACMYSLFITEVKLPFEASKLLFIPSKGIKFNIINLTFNKVLRNIKLCELNTKFNSFTLCSCNVKSLKRI